MLIVCRANKIKLVELKAEEESDRPKKAQKSRKNLVTWNFLADEG